MQIPNGSMRLRSNVKYQLLVGSPKHFHVHQRTAEDYQHVAFSEWQNHGHQAKGDPVDTSLMSSCSAWIRSTSSTPSTSFFFFFLQVQILQGWKRKPRPPLGHPSPSQSCQDTERWQGQVARTRGNNSTAPQAAMCPPWGHHQAWEQAPGLPHCDMNLKVLFKQKNKEKFLILLPRN